MTVKNVDISLSEQTVSLLAGEILGFLKSKYRKPVDAPEAAVFTLTCCEALMRVDFALKKELQKEFGLTMEYIEPPASIVRH